MGADPSDTLRLPKVRQRTGLGRSTIYHLVARGLFPAPVRLTLRAVGSKKPEEAESAPLVQRLRDNLTQG